MKRFDDLSDNAALLTPEQSEAFAAFSSAREKFSPLPPKMFESRGSNAWNMANLWLGTKAAPTAGAIMEQLEGMVASQQQLMDQVTQQTAANAEETASAAEELSAQAQTTKEQVAILSAQVGGSVDKGLRAYEKPHSRTRTVSYMPEAINVIRDFC